MKIILFYLIYILLLIVLAKSVLPKKIIFHNILMIISSAGIVFLPQDYIYKEIYDFFSVNLNIEVIKRHYIITIMIFYSFICAPNVVTHTYSRNQIISVLKYISFFAESKAKLHLDELKYNLSYFKDSIGKDFNVTLYLVRRKKLNLNINKLERIEFSGESCILETGWNGVIKNYKKSFVGMSAIEALKEKEKEKTFWFKTSDYEDTDLEGIPSSILHWIRENMQFNICIPIFGNLKSFNKKNEKGVIMIISINCIGCVNNENKDYYKREFKKVIDLSMRHKHKIYNMYNFYKIKYEFINGKLKGNDSMEG